MGRRGLDDDPARRDPRRQVRIRQPSLSARASDVLGGDQHRLDEGGTTPYRQGQRDPWFDLGTRTVPCSVFMQRRSPSARASCSASDFFHGESLGADADIAWFCSTPSMKAEDAHPLCGKAIGVFFNAPLRSPTSVASASDDFFLVLFNDIDRADQLHRRPCSSGALRAADARHRGLFNEGESVDAATATTVDVRSLAVFRRTG